MPDAFLETTALTNYTLKKDGSEKAVAATLAKYQKVLVPQFAWKEFKRGPLSYFIWAHNKFADTGSYKATMLALQSLSRSPKRYLTSTAIQAMHTAFVRAFDGVSLSELEERFGPKAKIDAVFADALRLEIKRVIFSSWGMRERLFGGPYHVLTCYPDRDLTDRKNRIEAAPRDCAKGAACCLKETLTSMPDELAKARSALKGEDTRREVTRRAKVLRQLQVHPNNVMGRKECQDLGDAYFVLFCPKDATIITTNMRDIEPMAKKLGRATESPSIQEAHPR
jgi:hypothetical protein